MTLALLLGLLLQSCAPSARTRIVRDSTYRRPLSPYSAEVTVVTVEETDTTVTRLSDTTRVEVSRSERCLHQEVVLRAKSKFHTQPHVTYLRARDQECQQPGMVTWETIRLRSRRDRRHWDASAQFRARTKRWLTTYLTSMYFDFPGLN